MMRDPDTATVIDIETKVDWPFVHSPEYFEPIERSYDPPAGTKTDLAIATHHTAWWANHRRRWNLDPLTGRIVSVAVADLWTGPVTALATDDERKLLNWLAAYLHTPQVLTGFRIRQFDVPFISARASVHGVELPDWWPHTRDYRYIADIADIATNGKLATWLHRCGLPPKTADGSAVELMPLAEVEAYNRNDVEVERELARRFAPNLPQLRRTRPPELRPKPDYDTIPL